jgi:hypothetical protein
VEQIIALKNNGVDADDVRALRAAGFTDYSRKPRDFSPGRERRPRVHGLPPEGCCAILVL